VKISASVIVYNEEANIRELCESIQWVDEIVIVDSFSCDSTKEIAAEFTDKIFDHEFTGYKDKHEFADSKTSGDWILWMDADERVTPELARRVEILRQRGLVPPAYEMPRRNHYLGRVVRGGIFVPDRKVRLFDRRAARWGGRNPHDKVVIDAGEDAVMRLAEPIEHFSYEDLDDHLRTIDEFTAIAARELRDEGRRFSWFDQLLRPPAVFGKSLFLKLGVRDGWRGVLIAAMAFYYDWLKYRRLRGEWQRRPEEAP
jgi:glycosyltransferase involved in cell wall biosynthesis